MPFPPFNRLSIPTRIDKYHWVGWLASIRHSLISTTFVGVAVEFAPRPYSTTVSKWLNPTRLFLRWRAKARSEIMLAGLRRPFWQSMRIPFTPQQSSGLWTRWQVMSCSCWMISIANDLLACLWQRGTSRQLRLCLFVSGMGIMNLHVHLHTSFHPSMLPLPSAQQKKIRRKAQYLPGENPTIQPRIPFMRKPRRSAPFFGLDDRMPVLLALLLGFQQLRFQLSFSQYMIPAPLAIAWHKLAYPGWAFCWYRSCH